MDISVERDGAQIENRSGGAHHVKSDPRVAKLGPKYPVAKQVVHHCESHHKAGYEEVCDGK